MGVLRDLLPPDETIVWISTPNSATARRRATIGVLAGICAVCAAAIALALVVTREPLAGAAFLGLLGILALLFAYELSETEIAVLSDHVVWNETGRLGRLFKRDTDLPKVRLDSIDRIDAEEGGGAVTLCCGDESHRIEEIVGGDVEAFTRATGRPARIWRRCDSPSANSARQWRSRTRIAAFLSIWFGLFLVLATIAGVQLDAPLEPDWKTLVGVVVAAVIVGIFADAFGDLLPHLFIGRALTGRDRQDFVCTMSDPRWDGVQPDDPGDSPPLGPFQRWAMRLAYGAVPDYEPWEPETIAGAAVGGR